MLAALRTRLERMREEVRRDETLITEQRARHEDAESDLRKRVAEAETLRTELEADHKLREEESRQFHERQALMETAVARLREVQDAVARQEGELRQREADLSALSAKEAENAALVQARADRLTEEQKRLEADRQSVGERETALARAEQTLALLQEQLRRRSEELVGRQKTQADLTRQQEETLSAWESRHADLERERQQLHEQAEALRQGLEERQIAVARHAAELELARADLGERERALIGRFERLKTAGRAVGHGKKSLLAARGQLQADQKQMAAELVQARLDFDVTRTEARDLQGQLPELESQAQAAANRLTQAREQLRGYLAEAHDYARQSRGDLEEQRKLVQTEAEQARRQHEALHKERDEHRLAVAAFRQHLLDWQGQVEEMRQVLLQGETRLERRQAEVAEQVRQVGATSARLAKQAEALQQQQRAVAERRGEVERHLEDMRQWYRRKMRELAGVPARQAITPALEEVQGEPSHSESPVAAGARDILSLTGDVAPADRHLGDLLRSLELVDADTLTALLVEARRQRRSLRQLLLSGNYLTLYQMALIEAGNVDALVLGPFRVIDRLANHATEAVYRVFDPRRNQEAILRHLSESEMDDAVHPDEFRQRFTAAAAAPHRHLAATFEVLDIAGRPAVLQELLRGVPASEWPPLAGVAGVWYRLTSQAFLGLRTAHQEGLVHGRLQARDIILTPEGSLKLCGFGEPAWLTEAEGKSAEGDAAVDVFALGQLVAGWTAQPSPTKAGKSKSLPASLQGLLVRLTTERVEERITSAAAVLEELNRAGAEVPANAAAWERFLREIREQATDAILRRSA
jgi:hypothetical protein